MSQMTDTTITERIADAEAKPIAERCAAMHALWWATRHDSDARRAVHAAVLRALPDAEAMPLPERIAALKALWGATSDGSDAERLVGAALDAAEPA